MIQKAIIITRAIDESPNPKELRALLDSSKILKIAINNVECKADIRIFLDWWFWRDFKKLGGKLMTRSEAIGTKYKPSLSYVPKEEQDNFIFFNCTKEPCTENETELFVCNSTLDTSIDFLYKLGVKEVLLIADNKIIEDGINFHKGFCEQMKKVVDFYSTKINIYQFSKGNFNVPVKTLKQFTNERREMLNQIAEKLMSKSVQEDCAEKEEPMQERNQKDVLANFGEIYLQRIYINNQRNVLMMQENSLNQNEMKLFEEYNSLIPQVTPEN